MIKTFQRILEQALERIARITTNYLPSAIAGLAILTASYVIAVLVRWFLHRVFKGRAFDRFLRRSGLTSALPDSERLRASWLVSATAYWFILILGGVAALDAFDTQLSSRMIETLVFLFPKLLTGFCILIAGIWLSQYLSRSALVWAVNGDIPGARRLASAVRILVVFVAVVVASDYLNFARSVFLASFILLVGGAVLAASLALGLRGKETLARLLLGEKVAPSDVGANGSQWNHL
jgi:hypothetical protein